MSVRACRAQMAAVTGRQKVSRAVVLEREGMLQRWRSRSESSEPAWRASRSAGRVGITRARVSCCAWPLNNRFQVNTGGETRDEKVSRHWACRIGLTGSVFPRTPHHRHKLAALPEK